LASGARAGRPRLYAQRWELLATELETIHSLFEALEEPEKKAGLGEGASASIHEVPEGHLPAAGQCRASSIGYTRCSDEALAVVVDSHQWAITARAGFIVAHWSSLTARQGLSDTLPIALNPW
jgi:hypothetical protein